MSEGGDTAAGGTRFALGDTLREAAAYLAGQGVAGGAGDARRLMAHVLGVETARLIVMAQDDIGARQRDRFWHLVHRRAAREPVSHLVGHRQFYGRRFAVGPDVLDPRPETEILIEAALAQPFDTVLDLGTGSGAIVLTLLAERPGATGIGTDLSARALAVAASNARDLGVHSRCRFRQSDWFANIDGAFGLIVSNPPYIAADEMQGLAPELTHEPRMALTDEGDGLEAYRAIAAGALAHLVAGGLLLLEIGPTQGGAVSRLLRLAGFHDIAILPDLDGRDRVVRARSG